MNSVALWVLLGIVIGTAGHVLDPSPAKGGLRGAILFGIGGALLGGGLATLLFSGALESVSILTILTASSVGMILLLIHRTLFSEQRKF